MRHEPPRLVPAAALRVETIVRRSRFISDLERVSSVDEAKAFRRRVQTEFPDATHHVPAWLIGHGPSAEAHSSDAGEPGGTAGRPLLAVLRGSGLGDVALVVTRYFGGIKLGSGGLVRAYSQAAHAAVDVVARAEKTTVHEVVLDVPYPHFESIRRLCRQVDSVPLDESFAESVVVRIRIRADSFEDLERQLAEATGGAVKPVIEATEPNALVSLAGNS